jgi:hypothetical protein
MKIGLLAGVFCTLVAAAAFADDTATANVRYDRDGDRTLVAHQDTDHSWKSYGPNELEFGVFGSGTVGRGTLVHPSSRRIERDGKLGMGLGMSYFLHRYVGVEGYAYSESTSEHFVDNVGGDLILRLPLGGSGVALYGLAGGVRQLDPAIQWCLDAGGGVEWRFTDHVGIFVDARYVWADKTRDYGLGRVGVKFGF